MPISEIYKAMKAVALSEFSDVAIGAQILCLPTGDPMKLRIDIVDGSLLDAYISLSGRYSYHWERRMTPAEDVYRYDNAPHERWRSLTSFPGHFHDGSESHVVARMSQDMEVSNEHRSKSYFPPFHSTSLGKISANTSRSLASRPRNKAVSRSSLSSRPSAGRPGSPENKCRPPIHAKSYTRMPVFIRRFNRYPIFCNSEV